MENLLSRAGDDGKQLTSVPTGDPAADVAGHPAWAELKDAVETVRPWQAKDGSIDLTAEDAPGRAAVERELQRIVAAVQTLAPFFPHDAAYLRALRVDLERWGREGFGVPDFLDSLLEFQPADHRVDGLRHLVLFPMYTQNGNPDRNLEAVLLRVFWPDWLADLERAHYDNPMFVPITFEDFTAGYDTDSAVLFPETIAVRTVPERFSWGGIFCDREAARFRRVSQAAVSSLGLDLPEEATRLVTDQDVALETFVLWDLIHDRTHSHGDLPFDPFMIKQRAPFWMYALEELRCDLTAFREGVRLAETADDTEQGARNAQRGRYLQFAMLFDRMFRFPITGRRVRNYDGLSGQLLFAYLHQNDALRWTDNTLRIDWDAAVTVTQRLAAEIEELYRAGIDRPKVVHWFAAYELISRHLAPHPGSVWARGPQALPLDQPPRKLVDEVLPDEFPLSMFYEALAKKLRDVVASTRGITSRTAA